MYNIIMYGKYSLKKYQPKVSKYAKVLKFLKMIYYLCVPTEKILYFNMYVYTIHVLINVRLKM